MEYKVIPHNSAALLNMPFAPSAAITVNKQAGGTFDVSCHYTTGILFK